MGSSKKDKERSCKRVKPESSSKRAAEREEQ